MRLIVAETFLLALVACAKGPGGEIVNLHPEPPTPAPLSGTWTLQSVEVVSELLSPETGSAAAPGPLPLMPPRIGDDVVIADGRFVSAAGRVLSREACEAQGVVIGEYFNQVGDEFALFLLECRRIAAPGVGETLRIALNADGEGRLLGLLQFRRYGEVLSLGTPVLGVYRIALEIHPDSGVPAGVGGR